MASRKAVPADLEQVMRRYKERLARQLETVDAEKFPMQSREYKQFKEEALTSRLSFYEKACHFSGKLLKLKLSPEQDADLKEAMSIAHLSIEPYEAIACSLVMPVIVSFLLFATSLFALDSLFFALFSIFAGITASIALNKLPHYLADGWRLRASNQMVLCIFYIVTYMRHTSNLERAIEFASQHLAPPLGLDMKKVLYDVETEKFESLKESLEAYLVTWRKYNREFIEAMHLIESSLYESSDQKRLSVLDKALDVILEETYEKMLHYAQNLKSPLTVLYMLGIILPILSLVMLPMILSFFSAIQWYHMFALYNVTLPVTVYFLGKNILAKRPTGYGDTDIAEINPQLKRYRNLIIKVGPWPIEINPIVLSVFIGVAFLFIAFLPHIVHIINPAFDREILGFKLLDFHESSSPELPSGTIVGPFGLGAALLSFFFPLALAFSIGLYYALRAKNVIKIREETKKLEDEFATSLFQLGNRLGDGIPAEIAFEKVAAVSQDTVAGGFFQVVVTNIRKMGMGVKDAIFHPQMGAVLYYPSPVIQSSMQVLVEAVRKGPVIASQAILNVARYIKEIHRVNERLRDLLADIIADVKSQIAFLTPTISGIVIGITSMITFIIGTLRERIGEQISAGEEMGNLGSIVNIFGEATPTYYFQLVVGIYVVQIVFILTILVNGIENGADKLNERYLLGRNLLMSTLLYCLIAGIVMIVFNVIAQNVIAGAIA